MTCWFGCALLLPIITLLLSLLIRFAFKQAHSVRFITFSPVRAIKVNKTSLRFWLAGIMFSIAHGILKVGHRARVYLIVVLSQPQTGWASCERGQGFASALW